MSAPALTRPTAPPRAADPNAGLPANALGKEKGALEQRHALRLRGRAVPRPGRRRPRRLGLGPVLARRRPRPSASTSSRCSASPSATTGTSPTGRSRRSGRCGSRWPPIGGDGDPGPGRAVGRRPPAAPRLLRPRGRPALAVALRHRHPRPGQGHVPRPPGLAVRPPADQPERYAPDLLKDGGLRVTSRLFVVWAFLSFALPRADRRPGHRQLGRRLVGVLLGRPGAGRAPAPRHLVDQLRLPRRRQPARSSPRAATGRPTSGRWRSSAPGESWHNLHHADPTCARHGVLRGQIDISARVIWLFEKLGWARDVKWPDPVRLAAKRRLVPATS